MGIRFKLITLLLLFGFMVLGTLIWSNQFVLHKTMLHYVDQRDHQRLERLQGNLEIYLDSQLITDISELNEVSWSRLLRYSHRLDFTQNSGLFESIIKKIDKPRRRNFPPDEFENRVSLVTSKGKVLFGNTVEPSITWLPIKINNKVVALVGYHPLQELIEKTDIEFSQNQFKLLSLGALFVTVLALLILWPLAQHLLAPIRQINQSMRYLTSGDFKHRLNVNRKDEFGELQSAVNHLAKTLQASQQSRNQWIADISHELRTPLTVLNGSIEAMRDGIRPINIDNINNLHQEVALLQRLIEDLYQLSLSDVGALQYTMNPTDISQLFMQTAAQFEAKAKSKGLKFQLSKIEKRAFIAGDKVRLQQMFINLMQNAIDYTDVQQENGNTGLIQFSLTKQDNNWLICIEDSAPAVSKQDLLHIQERFYRAETSRNRRTGGTGLGLAMVTQVVTAHDGNLTIKLSSLGGLKVCIHFPIKPIQAK